MRGSYSGKRPIKAFHLTAVRVRFCLNVKSHLWAARGEYEHKGIMFARALLAVLALPGVVAFAIPVTWLLANSRTRLMQPLGLVPLVVGVVALLWCVRDFFVSGKGTLAPWMPPAHLVVGGLYRYTRNPMYIAVTLVLLGWAASFGSLGLGVYTIIVAVAFHLRVVLGEEPWLARTHGIQWEQYADQVPRWFW